MLKLRTHFLPALALALICAFPVAAQQTTPTPRPAPAEPDYVNHTSFRNRIFEIRHRDPQTLAEALAALGSGHRGATLRPNRTFRTITVRDFPENIATMEEALRRLDTPETPQPDVELHMHILLASNAEGATEQLPGDLNQVVRQLRSTLNYRSYRLLASLNQRARENTHVRGTGVIEHISPPDPANMPFPTYSYSIDRLSVSSSSAGTSSVLLQELSFNMNVIEARQGVPVSMRTNLSLRDGERVVVGTSALRDKALILVISARIVR